MDSYRKAMCCQIFDNGFSYASCASRHQNRAICKQVGFRIFQQGKHFLIVIHRFDSCHFAGKNTAKNRGDADYC